MGETTTKACIVLGCDWKHIIPPEPNLMGSAQMVAMLRYREELEATLEEHLGKHTILEWVKTVMLWNKRAMAASDKLLEMQRELEREKPCPSNYPSCAKTFRVQ